MRAERVELSRACAHRSLSPARLPFPPRPHGGPSRARTGTLLAANEVHCHSRSGPRVPVGRIERPQAQCRAGYSRAPLANRGHRGGIGRCGRANRRGPDPQSGVLFSCQCAVIVRPFRQIGQGFAQQGWQESNPRPPGWSRLSVPLDYTPSSVCCMSCAVGPGTQKSRPLSEAAPQRTGRI